MFADTTACDPDILYNHASLIQYLDWFLKKGKVKLNGDDVLLTKGQLVDLADLKEMIGKVSAGTPFSTVFKKWEKIVYSQSEDPTDTDQDVTDIEFGTNKRQTAEDPEKLARFGFYSINKDISKVEESTFYSNFIYKKPSFCENGLTLLSDDIKNKFEKVRLYPRLFSETLPNLFIGNYEINTDAALQIFDIADKMAASFSVGGADDVSSILVNIFRLIFNKIDLTDFDVFVAIKNNFLKWNPDFPVNIMDKKFLNKFVTEYIHCARIYLSPNDDKNKSEEEKSNDVQIREIAENLIKKFLVQLKVQFRIDPQSFYPRLAPGSKINDYLSNLEEDIKDLLSGPQLGKKNKCAQIQYFIKNSLNDFRRSQLSGLEPAIRLTPKKETPFPLLVYKNMS